MFDRFDEQMSAGCHLSTAHVDEEATDCGAHGEKPYEKCATESDQRHARDGYWIYWSFVELVLPCL